jgi:hypothetical protein
MILYKRGEKYWNFEEEGVFYTPSKFTINTISNDFYIVYENNLKSKKYNVLDVTLTDLIGGGTFTFANINLFMQKLEELNCPCFQKDETTIINPPIDPSEFLPSDLTDYDDATLPIADTDDLLVNQGGDWKKVNKSDLTPIIPDATPNVKGIDFRKIFSFTSEISHTGTTLYTRLGSITIPANTIQVGDVWEVEMLVKRTSTNAVSSATIFAAFDSIGLETSGLSFIGGRIINAGNLNQVKITQSLKFSTNNVTYFRNTGGFYHENQNMQNRRDHAFNPTNQQTINFGLQLSNATDIAIVEYLIFKKIN